MALGNGCDNAIRASHDVIVDASSMEVCLANYEEYKAHVAFKIYKEEMENYRCRKIGDGSFFASKRAWMRLSKNFPVLRATEKRLLPLGFEGDARHVCEQLAGRDLDASCERLWEPLEPPSL